MFKIETLGTKFATIACTIVLSATMILGAVGPAQTTSPFGPGAISRIA